MILSSRGIKKCQLGISCVMTTKINNKDIAALHAKGTDDFKLTLWNTISCLITGSLIFFYIMPISWQVFFEIAKLNLKGSSTVSQLIGMAIYFATNMLFAIVFIKLQTNFLRNRSLKYRQIYTIIVSLFLFILLRITN